MTAAIDWHPRLYSNRIGNMGLFYKAHNDEDHGSHFDLHSKTFHCTIGTTTDTRFSEKPAIDIVSKEYQSFIGNTILVGDVYSHKTDKAFFKIPVDNVHEWGDVDMLISGCAHHKTKVQPRDIFDCYPKNQSCVQTATFGLELVAASAAVDQIVELCTTLRYLGVPIDAKSYMFGDNQAVVTNSTIPQ
jgi:hypothetical protein